MTHDIEENSTDDGGRSKPEECAAPYLCLEVAYELLAVVRAELVARALEGLVIRELNVRVEGAVRLRGAEAGREELGRDGGRAVRVPALIKGRVGALGLVARRAGEELGARAASAGRAAGRVRGDDLLDEAEEDGDWVSTFGVRRRLLMMPASRVSRRAINAATGWVRSAE
jgi:hypothetical protein